MARIGNKKSRNGCVRCKNRRVKCDEVRPSCGWCASHAFRCEYPSPIYINRTSNLPAVLSHSVPQDNSQLGDLLTSRPLALADTRKAKLELGLFQYYIYTVARTFPYVDRELGLRLHADFVPQASLQCTNLLNVMCSYALLHIHIQHSVYNILPRNADFFNEVGLFIGNFNHAIAGSGVDPLSLHRDYLDRALQGQRDIVTELNHKNADGVCIAAVLLAQVALVHSSQTTPDQDYDIPYDWFRLQSSFSACLAVARPLLNMDSATSTMIHSFPSIDNRDLEYQDPQTLRHLLDWQPKDGTEMMSYQTRETYRKCIVYIETIHKRIAQQEPWQSLGRRILAFPAVGLSSFLGLIEEHQPRALVVLAHLLAMTKRLNTNWWIFRGVADYHVRGILTLVPDEWQWAMQWPLRVLDTGAADECFLVEKPNLTLDETAISS